MRIKLDEKWIQKLMELPESGMGYQRVNIYLSDNRVIKDVCVYNSEILELPENYNDVKPESITNIVSV